MRRSVTRDNEQLNADRREKLGILDSITLNGGKRFCSIRNAGGVAEIDEVFVRKTVMERPVNR